MDHEAISLNIDFDLEEIEVEEEIPFVPSEGKKEKEKENTSGIQGSLFGFDPETDSDVEVEPGKSGEIEDSSVLVEKVKRKKKIEKIQISVNRPEIKPVPSYFNNETNGPVAYQGLFRNIDLTKPSDVLCRLLELSFVFDMIDGVSIDESKKENTCILDDDSKFLSFVECFIELKENFPDFITNISSEKHIELLLAEASKLSYYFENHEYIDIMMKHGHFDFTDAEKSDSLFKKRFCNGY